MAFTERLNSLLDALDCTDLQIAKASLMHLSSVRQLRGREQLPVGKNRHNYKKQLVKLCKGLIIIAEQNGQTDLLREFCCVSVDEEITQELLFACFMKEETTLNEGGGEKYRRGRTHFRLFAQRFSHIMKLLGISGMRLSGAVNIDPSLISRFKKGVRMPYDELVMTICDYLYNRAVISSKLKEFCALLKIEEQTALSDKELTIKILYNFLAASELEKSSHIVDDFIEKFSAFSFDGLPSLPLPDTVATPEILNERDDTYCGTEGLRRAVIRFLCSAIYSDEPETLLLYSDQNLEWMTGDPEFTKKWEFLMVSLVQRKHRVKIVHNINRSLNEMFQAINKWIPLYMSGQIESFYNKRNPGNSFAHTLFISSSAAISSCVARGTEESGEYHYSTGSALPYYKNQFANILASSGSLVQVFKQGDTKELLLLQDDMADSPGRLQRLLSSLPIETLPEELFAAIVGRCCLNKQTAEELRGFYESKKHTFYRQLANGGISEYVCADASRRHALNTCGLLLPEHIYYEDDEYSLHLENTIRLLDGNRNYELGLLEERLFPDIEIAVKRESNTLVTKDSPASVAVNFSHDMMTSAFFEYVSDIRERLAVMVRNSSEMTEYLKKSRSK